MKKLIIAIDCDDVVVRTTEFFIQKYNLAYGTSVEAGRIHEPDYDGWQTDHTTLLERLQTILKSEEYKELGPNIEEVEVLKRLGGSHELHLVTARKPEELEMTEAMLERDVPGVFTSLEFVGHDGSKGEVCSRIMADVLIDDSVRHLEDAIARGLPPEGAILFGNYEWNNGDHASYITRCHSWSEVEKHISQLV